MFEDVNVLRLIRRSVCRPVVDWLRERVDSPRTIPPASRRRPVVIYSEIAFFCEQTINIHAERMPHTMRLDRLSYEPLACHNLSGFVCNAHSFGFFFVSTCAVRILRVSDERRHTPTVARIDTYRHEQKRAKGHIAGSSSGSSRSAHFFCRSVGRAMCAQNGCESPQQCGLYLSRNPSCRYTRNNVPHAFTHDAGFERTNKPPPPRNAHICLCVHKFTNTQTHQNQAELTTCV